MRSLIVLLALLVLFPASVAAQNEPGAQGPVQIRDLYPVVVEIEAGENPYSHANKVLRDLDVPRGEFSTRIRYTYEHALTGYALLLTPYEIQRFERIYGEGEAVGVTNLVTEQITFSVPDTVTQFDVQGRASDALTGTEVIPVGVSRVAGRVTTTDNVDVAIIDTGTDARNPELNVVGGYDCVDPNQDYGFDGHGHGTHVGGTIGAREDGRGVVGVAPGSRLFSVRVLDSSGSGSLASVICGIDWVAGHADTIDVVNMSLGGANPFGDTVCGGPDPMHNAICGATDLGVVFVVAAGNSTEDARYFAPAAYDEVVTVSAYTDFDGRPGGFALAPNAGCVAMSVDDELASFSNYGDAVDVAAPGVCVLSTYLEGKYAYASGTSMASPHVAGCMARYLHDNPDQRDRVVDQVLRWSDSRSEFELFGDHDGVAEPVLNCAGIPRA